MKYIHIFRINNIYKNFANTISTISFPINVYRKIIFVDAYTHIQSQKEIFQRFYGRGTINAHSDE